MNSSPETRENRAIEGVLPKLDPGDYKYITYLFDNADNFNYTTWEDSMTFSIDVPMISEFIILINFIVFGAIIVFMYRKNSIPFPGCYLVV